MPTRTPPAAARRAAVRLAALRQQIAAVEYLCSGTLLRRRKRCGKAGCACAADPAARHGPYYEWSRREANRLVHTVLPPALAPAFAQAVRNHRRVRLLLRQWERESVRVLLAHLNEP